MLLRKKRKIFLFRSDSSGHSTWEGLSHDFRALPHSHCKEKSFTFYLSGLGKGEMLGWGGILVKLLCCFVFSAGCNIIFESELIRR